MFKGELRVETKSHNDKKPATFSPLGGLNAHIRKKVKSRKILINQKHIIKQK